MTMIGQCHICGRPANTTCPICGLLVCSADSDPVSHVCRVCSKRRMKVPGKSLS